MEQLWTMRRKDREIDDVEARQILKFGEYGVLSTIGPDGSPYGVPISYAFHDEVIYFHSAPEGRKIEHLNAVPHASFCVVGATEVQPEMFSTRYESAIASGEVRELVGEEKQTALAFLIQKYSPDFIPQGMEYIAEAQGSTRAFALQVRHLSGKRRR